MIKERNKTDKEKKKEIKIIENKAFLPLFHCPFVKLFSLVIITSNHWIMKFQPEINANNVILSALASTLLQNEQNVLRKAAVNLPFRQNPASINCEKNQQMFSYVVKRVS